MEFSLSVCVSNKSIANVANTSIAQISMFYGWFNALVYLAMEQFNVFIIASEHLEIHNDFLCFIVMKFPSLLFLHT